MFECITMDLKMLYSALNNLLYSALMLYSENVENALNALRWNNGSFVRANGEEYSRIQIPEYKFQNTNSGTQIPEYKFQNTNFRIQILEYVFDVQSIIYSFHLFAYSAESVQVFALSVRIFARSARIILIANRNW